MSESWSWNKNDLERLIGQAESIRLDFKQSKLFNESRENIAKNLSKEVSAFANTEGGTIVIGIVEQKNGKSRIASEIDDGVDIASWSPEIIQQLIESNVRPYLTGLRVRAIPLDSENTKFAYSIYVPQGTTAYQASDYIYYGRSEFEAKALPDHEVRLRMFRGKTASAEIRVIDCSAEKYPIAVQDVKNNFGDKADYFIGNQSYASHQDKIFIKRFRFSLGVVNVGEINISEFKAELAYKGDKRFSFNLWPSYIVKDGWHDFGTTNLRPMQVNIYPQDIYLFERSGQYVVHMSIDQNLQELELIIDTRLYLSNTLPIKRRINLVDEFEQAIVINKTP